jgi:hypothetical protein
MRTFPLILAAAGSLAAATQSAAEPRIGTAAITKNEVTGTLGPNRRALKLGDGVFQNESVATGDSAGAQILFADETALTMGPNSRVTLDKLVYDPTRKRGELAIRTTTGVFRFISGSGPKAGYNIDTPMGTIGVRGTIISWAIQGPWLTLSLIEGGASLCTAARRCVELDKPGTYVVTNGTQLGDTKSSYGKACDSSGPTKCVVGDGSDSLYLQYIGLRTLHQLAPGAGPNDGPPGPPPPPPPTGGFPPIQTGAGTVPPGLQSHTPPGIERNRGPGNLPPGHQRR